MKIHTTYGLEPSQHMSEPKVEEILRTEVAQSKNFFNFRFGLMLRWLMGVLFGYSSLDWLKTKVFFNRNTLLYF